MLTLFNIGRGQYIRIPNFTCLASPVSKTGKGLNDLQNGWLTWKQQTSPKCCHVPHCTKRRVVFDSGPFIPLRENMKSFTKPDVRYIAYCIIVRRRPSHGHM